MAVNSFSGTTVNSLQAAGKNKILNGDFGIWQRGTTFSNPNFYDYTADRWRMINYDVKPTSATHSQQIFTPGSAPVSGYEGQYFYRSTITTAGTCTAYDFGQYIEDVRTFAGTTTTLSFWAKADTARTLNIQVGRNMGTGGSGGGTVTVAQTSFSVTTSWQRFSTSVTWSSLSGSTVGTNSNIYVLFRQPVASGSILDIWGVQLEAGSVATPFTTATGNPASELAACQRYYWDSREGGSTVQPYSSYSNSTEYLIANVRYPSTMRTTPSVTIGTASGANYVRRISTNGQLAITVTSYAGQSPTGFSGVYCAAAPFVAAVGYDFYILASAEL